MKFKKFLRVQAVPAITAHLPEQHQAIEKQQKKKLEVVENLRWRGKQKNIIDYIMQSIREINKNVYYKRLGKAIFFPFTTTCTNYTTHR